MFLAICIHTMQILSIVLKYILSGFSAASHKILSILSADSKQILSKFSPDTHQILSGFSADSQQILSGISEDSHPKNYFSKLIFGQFTIKCRSETKLYKVNCQWPEGDSLTVS